MRKEKKNGSKRDIYKTYLAFPRQGGPRRIQGGGMAQEAVHCGESPEVQSKSSRAIPNSRRGIKS